MGYHDRLVASPQYRQAYDLANQVAARLEQTWLYSTARARLPASAVETGEWSGQEGEVRAAGAEQWQLASLWQRC